MTRDLAGLLADAVAETEQVLPPELGRQALPGLHRRVVRRRTGRHLVESGGVLAVAAVVGLGAWLGVQHQPAPPATPAPTTAPLPVISPAPDAAGLPPALVLPDGMLEGSRPGWALQQTRPTYVDGDTDGATANAIDLVSPQGDRYRVLDLPTDSEGQTTLVSWRSGETSAVVAEWTPEGTTTLASLDLLTGTSTPIPGTEAYAGSGSSVAADGSVLWVDDGTSTSADEPGGLYRLRPSGAVQRVAELGDSVADGTALTAVDPTSARVVVSARPGGKRLAVYDLASGAPTTIDVKASSDLCDVVAWSSVSTLLVVCHDEDPNGTDVRLGARLYSVDVENGTTTLVNEMPDREHVPRGWSGAWVSDGVVAFGAADDVACETGIEVWDGTRSTVLEDLGDEGYGSFAAQAAAGEVFVERQPTCEGDGGPSAWTAHDLSTGASVVLNSSTPDDPPAGTWVQVMAAEVVARS